MKRLCCVNALDWFAALLRQFVSFRSFVFHLSIDCESRKWTKSAQNRNWIKPNLNRVAHVRNAIASRLVAKVVRALFYFVFFFLSIAFLSCSCFVVPFFTLNAMAVSAIRIQVIHSHNNLLLCEQFFFRSFARHNFPFFSVWFRCCMRFIFSCWCTRQAVAASNCLPVVGLLQLHWNYCVINDLNAVENEPIRNWSHIFMWPCNNFELLFLLLFFVLLAHMVFCSVCPKRKQRFNCHLLWSNENRFQEFHSLPTLLKMNSI